MNKETIFNCFVIILNKMNAENLCNCFVTTLLCCSLFVTSYKNIVFFIIRANLLPYLRQIVYIIGTCIIHQYFVGTVVVVFVWQLNLQQSVSITTNVVSSNHANGEVYSIQHYVIKFVSDLREVCVFSGHSSFLHQ